MVEKSLKEYLAENARKTRIKNAANGYKLVKCDQCGGTGESEPGVTDYDAHGSFWVEASPCRFCELGQKKIRCTAKERATALRMLLAEVENEDVED